jgi:hypothetical protein
MTRIRLGVITAKLLGILDYAKKKLRELREIASGKAKRIQKVMVSKVEPRPFNSSAHASFAE